MQTKEDRQSAYKKGAIKTAKELCYSKSVIEKIQNALNEREITRILIDARRSEERNFVQDKKHECILPCTKPENKKQTMNIYWCYDKFDYSGLYIIAETRGKAKLSFQYETDCDYMNVRSQIYRKNVYEKAGIISFEDTKLLDKYNLKYADEGDMNNENF